MKTKEEIREWLLKNAVNKKKIIDLRDIDFGDKVVDFSGTKAKRILNAGQKAGVIINSFQKAEDICNDYQKGNYILNSYQKARIVINNFQEAKKIGRIEQKQLGENNE